MTGAAEGVRVLGVDPALRRSGWAVAECRPPRYPLLLALGSIKCLPAPRAEQPLTIGRQFRAVLELWRPNEAWLEQPGYWMRRAGTSRKSVEALAQSWAVMLLACAELGVIATEADFHTVRRALIGRRNADASCIVSFLNALGFVVPALPRGAPDLDVANGMTMAVFGAWMKERR